MNKNAFLWGAFLLAIFSSGCANWSGRYISNHQLAEPEPYPFAFCINSVKMLPDTAREQTAADISEEDEKKMEILQKKLCESYPQYFTLKPENAFPIDITVTPSEIAFESGLGVYFRSLLSGLTYGLIPVSSLAQAQWEIVIKPRDFESNGFEASNQLRMKVKRAVSVYLGTLLQTHRLVPYMKDYHVCSNGNEDFRFVFGFADENQLFDPESPALLEFFPDALRRFDRDKVEEYFYSHYCEEQEFLE